VNERLSAELADRLTPAESLLAIASTIGSTLDLAEALRRICRELARLTGADSAGAYLYDGNRDLLVPTAAYRLPKEHLPQLASAAIPLRQQGFHLPLWTTRRPVHSADVAHDERFSHAMFREIPHQSGLVLPLVLDEEVAGAFYLVWWTVRRTFTEPELALLDQVSGQVGLLVRNVRLYEQADRDRRRLETLYDLSGRLAALHDADEMLGLILEEATRAVGGDGAAIRLLDRGELVMAAQTEGNRALGTRPRLKVGESLTGLVVENGEPLVVNDIASDPRCDAAVRAAVLAQGLKSFVGVPLRSHGLPLGTLTIHRKTDRRFTPDEVGLLTALADHASLALEKSRLLRGAEHGRQLLERLYEVALSMQASWDREDRLRAFVLGAAEVVGFDRVDVRLVTPDGALELVAMHGEGEDPPPGRLPLTPEAGPYYQAFATRRTVAMLSDADLATVLPLGPAFRELPVYRTRRFVVAPIVVGERFLGVVSADNKPSRRPISAAALEPFRLLCQQLAMALEEARLYAETQAREQEATKLATGLSLLNQASRALYRTLDVDGVLRGALDELAQAFGAGAVLVVQVDERGDVVRRVGRWLSDEHGRDVVTRQRGLTQIVRDARKPIVLHDVSRHADIVQPAHLKHGVRSLMAVPLVGQGDRVLGVLYLYYTTPQAFPGSEVSLLTAYAAQLATALENAQLYEEAQSQRTRLRLIFDSTSDGILLIGRDGRVEAANRRAAELLGFDHETVAGASLTDLLAARFRTTTESLRVGAAFRALLETPEPGGQGDLEISEPAWRVLHWVGQPTRNATGATIGLTLTFQDVTEEREVSQMKSDFVSFVTHQLRTPLAGIKWLLELAVHGSEVPEVTRSYVQDAREANERLIGLVNDLLNVSHLESGKISLAPRATDLAALTADVVNELGPLLRDKGHRWSVDVGEGLPPVMVDPQLMRQVVLNLISNAVKYTKPGGEIAVHISRDAGTVRWLVRDSGIGIPREARGRLFEKFFRAENVLTLETEGTGLGLYLVRLILEQFGGRIACESEEGQGSTFVFTLPLPD
jgi:PAS domain S-box-containing protein